MAQARTIDPPGWKRGPGYSHAIDTGERLVVAGVLPWDPGSQKVTASGFASQWGQALDNLGEVLAAAGYSAQEVVCLRVYVTDLGAYREAAPELGDAWQRIFGRYFPAVTLVAVAALVEDDALVEIEAEAVRQDDD